MFTIIYVPIQIQSIELDVSVSENRL